ncbi:MAG: glycoside hydrolase N-terminal domain-containing protein, partial [Acutalibacteraceae bacterium]
MFDDSKTLYYNKPAENWLEALPLGNGSIGAMIYGKTYKETVAMNSDTLWSGYPRETQVKKGAYENFLKARELTMQGEYKQAEEIINNSVLSNCCQAYMPLCHIDIEYGFSGFKKNYKRYLDLETGINTVEFKRGKNSFKRESFVSYPENVYVDNIKSVSGGKFGLKVSLSIQLKAEDKNVTDNILYIDGLCPSDSKMNLDTYAGMKGSLYPEDKSLQGIHYRCAVKVVTDGNTEYSKDNISVKDASFVTIVFATANSFNGYKKHPTLEGKEYKNACINHIKNVTDSYESLKNAHIE